MYHDEIVDVLALQHATIKPSFVLNHYSLRTLDLQEFKQIGKIDTGY